MTRLFGAALAAVALVVAPGCGGSSSSSAPSKPLTRAELTAKANTICKRIIAQVDWQKANPKTLPRLIDHLAALEEQAASELEKLTPPPAMADEWRLLVDGFKLSGPEMKQIADGVAQVPGEGVPLSNAQHERAVEAKDLGVSGCEGY